MNTIGPEVGILSIFGYLRKGTEKKHHPKNPTQRFQVPRYVPSTILITLSGFWDLLHSDGLSAMPTTVQQAPKNPKPDWNVLPKGPSTEMMRTLGFYIGILRPWTSPQPTLTHLNPSWQDKVGSCVRTACNKLHLNRSFHKAR